MEVDKQQHQQMESVVARDSVNSSNMATKPHDMPLNGDLTSDELTQQLHLSAKSPMSDDSGVVLDEAHIEHNGSLSNGTSLPMTPEAEETRWNHERIPETGDDWKDVSVNEDSKQQLQTTEEISSSEDYRSDKQCDSQICNGELQTTDEFSSNKVDSDTVESERISSQIVADGISEEMMTLEIARPAKENIVQEDREAAAADAQPATVIASDVAETSAANLDAGEEEAISAQLVHAEESVPRTDSATSEENKETQDVRESEGDNAIQDGLNEEHALEETHPETIEPEDDENDRVEFTKGLHCDNVIDALSILKTHYKLSKPAPKKNVITFSCWNLRDVTNTPTHVASTNRLSQPLAEQDDHLIDILDEILNKEKEIDKLLEQVMEKERRKNAEEKKTDEDKKRLLEGNEADNDLPIVEESLNATDVATAPTLESSPPPAVQSPVEQKDDQKKKRGRLVRMLQALRKRFRR